MAELNELSKAKAFAHWIGRSESLLRNVENRVIPLSGNLARRIAERTGVSEEWMMADPPDDQPIRANNGEDWDPHRLLDPLVLGNYDFRSALPMAPGLVLQLALVLIETCCTRALDQSSHAPLIRLMDLIKREIDITDAEFVADVEARLLQPEYADVLQLWTVACLAAKQRRNNRLNTSSATGRE